MVVGEEHGLPEASARRLVRIDIQAVTLGRGSETSLGMMLCGGLRPFEGAPQKTLIEPGKRVRNVEHTWEVSRYPRDRLPLPAARQGESL